MFDVVWVQLEGPQDEPVSRVVGSVDDVILEIIDGADGLHRFELRNKQSIWVEVDATQPIVWRILLYRCTRLMECGSVP